MNLLIVCDTEKAARVLHARITDYFIENEIKVLFSRLTCSIAMIDPCEKIGILNVEKITLSHGNKIRVIPKYIFEEFDGSWVAVRGEVIEKALDAYYKEVSDNHV